MLKIISQKRNFNSFELKFKIKDESRYYCKENKTWSCKACYK